MKNNLLRLIPVLVLFTSSCCQNVSTTCTNGKLVVFAAGFQESDLNSYPVGPNSAYALRYKQDNAFDVLIDTLFISSYKNATDSFGLVFSKSDTAQTSSYITVDSFGNGLLPGYDYKIVFPADTLSYAITNINLVGISQMELKRCGDVSPPKCYKNVISCNINGTLTSTISTPNNVNLYMVPNTIIYLSK